ncbi:MAG: hypothetical protein QOG80_2629 [Pseudonocardiales bacterium]|nr:hypothetical protein [Pseudonocardiales bacterium]
MVARRAVAAALALGATGAALLAACSSSAGYHGSGILPAFSTGSTGPTVALQSAGPGSYACSGYTAGRSGVLQVFCSGTGQAKVTIGGAAKTLTGGDCRTAGTQIAINFGVITGPGFASSQPKPDYVGALVDPSGGGAGAFTARIDGQGGIVLQPHSVVTADKKTITLTGTLLGTSDAVKVDITC